MKAYLDLKLRRHPPGGKNRFNRGIQGEGVRRELGKKEVESVQTHQ